jgi:hypothetical protein
MRGRDDEGARALVREAGGKALLRLRAFGEPRGYDAEPAAGRDGVAVDRLRAARAAIHAAAAPAGPPVGPMWQSLGPTRIPNGQTYGSGTTPVSGRVAAIAVDPSNSAHVLCGAAGGGVWETRDAGATWAPRTDGLPTLAVGALAFDPSTPATVYLGTGEGNFYWSLGAGLFRSTDGGTTFSLLNGSTFAGQGFFDLVVDSQNGRHLYAATSDGLYVTQDGGVTFTQRRNATTWAVSQGVTSTGSRQTLAACADGLFRTSTGGASWSAVSLPGAPAGWDRLSVRHAPSGNGIAYVFGASGGTAYLYRRQGTTWRRVTALNGVGVDVSQAWYDWFLGVSPDNANQIYLGAIEAYRGDRTGSTWTWQDISSRQHGDSIHPDQHAIAFDPAHPATIYVGCDGGIFRSSDRGAHWTPLNAGLGITEVEYLAHDPGSATWLFCGTQDNGSLLWTGGASWSHVLDGDGGDCVTDSANAQIVIGSHYYMGLERSTDKGAHWTYVTTGPTDPSTYAQLFYPPVDGRGATVAQAGQSVFVSRDAGATFREVKLPGTPTASAMDVPTPDRILLGTTNGAVFRLTFAASTWTVATLTSPRAAWISDLKGDPANASRVWATSSYTGGGRVFRSDDGGATWHDCSAGLPAIPVNAIEVDPTDPTRVFVAADVGVYTSRDAGATWARFGTGLPNALVEDLLFHPGARLLRAGTRNRGVFELDVDG